MSKNKKEVDIYLDENMDNEGVKELAIATSHYKENKINLHCCFNGGNVVHGDMMSNIVKDRVNKIYLYYAASCGIFPFFILPLKKRFLHNEFYYIAHNVSLKLENRVNLKAMDENKRFLDLAQKRMENLIGKENAKTDDKHLLVKDFIKKGWVLKENIFKTI